MSRLICIRISQAKRRRLGCPWSPELVIPSSATFFTVLHIFWFWLFAHGMFRFMVTIVMIVCLVMCLHVLLRMVFAVLCLFCRKLFLILLIDSFELMGDDCSDASRIVVVIIFSASPLPIVLFLQIEATPRLVLQQT